MTLPRRLASLLLLVALACAGPAWADWRRAETDHFIVYSNGSERSLRDYAIRLERFNGLLQSLLSGGREQEGRKLPVYLVADGRELRVANPSLPEGIAGYYWTSEADTLAVLVRGRDDDLLLHEYAHHFMATLGDGRYPGWLNEGYAEYFATATTSERGRATFGQPPAGRQQALAQRRWMPMDALLRARGAFDVPDRDVRQMYYAQSWLLTHWLASDSERLGRLSAYLSAVNGGADAVEAWRAAFGQTPDDLAAALRAYLRGRLYYAELDLPAMAPSVTVARLSPAADAVLLPSIRAREARQDASEGPSLLETFRDAATRHPADPLALAALGRAEMKWGEEARAEAALQRALETDPDHVEALFLMGRLLDARADEASDEADEGALRRRSQASLVRAMEADPTDYRVYAALARQRRTTSSYPTENDLALWDMAVRHAPQLMSIRADAAQAMLEAGRLDEAAGLLTPIVNDPHGAAGAAWARDLLARIAERRAGDRAEPAPTP